MVEQLVRNYISNNHFKVKKLCQQNHCTVQKTTLMGDHPDERPPH